MFQNVVDIYSSSFKAINLYLWRSRSFLVLQHLDPVPSQDFHFGPGSGSGLGWGSGPLLRLYQSEMFSGVFGLSLWFWLWIVVVSAEVLISVGLPLFLCVSGLWSRFWVSVLVLTPQLWVFAIWPVLMVLCGCQCRNLALIQSSEEQFTQREAESDQRRHLLHTNKKHRTDTSAFTFNTDKHDWYCFLFNNLKMSQTYQHTVLWLYIERPQQTKNITRS